MELRHKPVPLTSVEWRELNEEMDELLGHQEDMKLRAWRIRGKLSEFMKDLIAN